MLQGVVVSYRDLQEVERSCHENSWAVEGMEVQRAAFLKQECMFCVFCIFLHMFNMFFYTF